MLLTAGEKLFLFLQRGRAEVYVGPLVGGGIEGWIAYVAALGFLLVRPAGLFGQRSVERA
jgi:branched-chain amino acid transport system permease protein